jgi:hypothetical protein
MPPSIPTSFVPRESVQHRHLQTNFIGLFAWLSYVVFGIVCLLAVGVFFYSRILSTTEAARETALAAVEKGIDPATVDSFVKLRNRLNSSQNLLKNHIAFSNFFTSIEAILPATVRLTTLHISIDPTGVSKIDGAGIAKTFNALANASAAFATEGRIKDVIFSKISILRDGTVSFGISATLDPKIVTYTPSSYAAAAPSAATTTTP